LPTEHEEDAYLGYFPDAELVFGICSPLGTQYAGILESLKNYLSQFNYVVNEVKLSDTFDDLLKKLGQPPMVSPAQGIDQISAKINAGNAVRIITKKMDILALAAVAKIAAPRHKDGTKPTPYRRTAHIIVSLKRPEEVDALRRIYGPGFYLIGISSRAEECVSYLAKERGFTKEQAEQLIQRDAEEAEESGQRTRDTFALSDVFLTATGDRTEIERFLDLVFGDPFLTPTPAERSMYAAYGASFASGDLARQVGAALINHHGELLAVGWNDVPKARGGLYYCDPNDARDVTRGYDANDKEKAAMAERIIEQLASGPNSQEQIREALRKANFYTITEFQRAVHAEMEALLSCGRKGLSTLDSDLYVTTFPCHNCARHIIAAGIRTVYYIEPYAKSRAFDLHRDAITALDNDVQKVRFLPFAGIGPRRFLDLFSLTLGTGERLERKKAGMKVNWHRGSAAPRLQMQPISYLERETLAMGRYNQIVLAIK
jgi:deoxycytidylate deaminase